MSNNKQNIWTVLLGRALIKEAHLYVGDECIDSRKNCEKCGCVHKYSDEEDPGCEYFMAWKLPTHN